MKSEDHEGWQSDTNDNVWKFLSFFLSRLLCSSISFWCFAFFSHSLASPLPSLALAVGGVCVCVFVLFFCFDALRIACNASGNVLYVTLSSALEKYSNPMHTHIHFPPSLLLYSSLCSNGRSLACSFSFFSMLCCVLFPLPKLTCSIFLLSFFFFIRANAMLRLLLLVLLILLPSLVFFYAISYFYINFRLEYMAQCSYCGKNSIRFLSLPPLGCHLSLSPLSLSLLLCVVRLLIYFFSFTASLLLVSLCFFFSSSTMSFVDVFTFRSEYVRMSVQIRKEIEREEKRKKNRQIERMKWWQKDATVVCLFCARYFLKLFFCSSSLPLFLCFHLFFLPLALCYFKTTQRKRKKRWKEKKNQKNI